MSQLTQLLQASGEPLPAPASHSTEAPGDQGPAHAWHIINTKFFICFIFFWDSCLQ